MAARGAGSLGLVRGLLFPAGGAEARGGKPWRDEAWDESGSVCSGFAGPSGPW